MYWTDVAMILFSCVAVNHLGLVHAVETVIKRRLPIVNCPRCLSFWSVLTYMLTMRFDLTASFATSFLCAALAPWLELLMGFTDSKFNEYYDKIYLAAEDECLTEADFEESD